MSLGIFNLETDQRTIGRQAFAFVEFGNKFFGIIYFRADKMAGRSLIRSFHKLEKGIFCSLEAVFFPLKRNRQTIKFKKEKGGVATIKDVVGKMADYFAIYTMQLCDLADQHQIISLYHTNLCV